MGTKEAVVEQYLVKEVKKRGGIAYKFTSPGRRSVPDRLVVLPNMILFVECKVENGKLTSGQEREIALLQKMGMTAAVVYSKANVDNLMKTIEEAFAMRRFGNHA